MSTPFLVIGAAASGSGKTTVAAGLMAAFRRRGLAVQPFKVGPDYIDPSYHRMAAGVPSRNVDSWMVTPQRAGALAHHAAHGADVALVEGVMGLYDGAGYEEETGSTAHAAKLLGAPVVLVLDVSKAARSVAALALGFRQFDPELRLAGFIANRCGSAGHGEGVCRAIERATGLPCFGWLPRRAAITFPSRHLGLVPSDEQAALREAIDGAADLVEEHLDLDALLAVAQAQSEPVRQQALPSCLPAFTSPSSPARLAVARDEAFSFYYEDNLELLRRTGLELVPFSPLQDERLPAGIAGLYLGGGFPELHAGRLARNGAMQDAIRSAAAAGLPIYAECGGFMYLAEELIDQEGERYPMVGLVPGSVTMQRRRVRLGYCEVQGDHWLLQGAVARGHEFHWSSWDGDDGRSPAFTVRPRKGSEPPRPVGYRAGNLIASYVHLHFASNPAMATAFAEACRRHLAGREAE